MFQYFFNSYEECDIICSNNAALGDLNNDGYLNVLDVVSIVNFVLNNEYMESSDLNFDGFVNVIDIVALVNIIVSSNEETRDTWQIINEDILTPK